MKNNNKNRKLIFIRKKNLLRRGLTRVIYVFKFSSKMNLNSVVVDHFLKKAKNEVKNQYKLTLRNADYYFEILSDDFAKDLISLVITLDNKKISA